MIDVGSKTLQLDPRLALGELRPWLQEALVSFGISGFWRFKRRFTMEDVHDSLDSPDLFFSKLIEAPDGKRAMAIVMHKRWEERVTGYIFGAVTFFAAETFELAVELAETIVDEARNQDCLLLTANVGNLPNYIPVAWQTAGFHFGGETLTVAAYTNDAWREAQKIPVLCTFRRATESDLPVIKHIAERTFAAARLSADPHFPQHVATKIYGKWAEDLGSPSCSDEVMLAILKSRIAGFVTLKSYSKGHINIPGLLAVHPDFIGSGVGAMLVRCLIEWHFENGSPGIYWNTEKTNAAMNDIYLRLAFGILDSNVLYHWTNQSSSGFAANQ